MEEPKEKKDGTEEGQINEQDLEKVAGGMTTLVGLTSISQTALKIDSQMTTDLQTTNVAIKQSLG